MTARTEEWDALWGEARGKSDTEAATYSFENEYGERFELIFDWIGHCIWAGDENDWTPTNLLGSFLWSCKELRQLGAVFIQRADDAEGSQL